MLHAATGNTGEFVHARLGSSSHLDSVCFVVILSVLLGQCFVCQKIWRKGICSDKCILHHKNEPIHTALWVRQFLANK